MYPASKNNSIVKRREEKRRIEKFRKEDRERDDDKEGERRVDWGRWQRENRINQLKGLKFLRKKLYMFAPASPPLRLPSSLQQLDPTAMLASIGIM